MGERVQGLCDDSTRALVKNSLTKGGRGDMREHDVIYVEFEKTFFIARMRKTSSPLPGETYREMMERHAVAQQERQRRNSYIVPPVTSRGSVERMTSANEEFRRRRMSSASSTSSGAGDSRRSSVDSR